MIGIVILNYKSGTDTATCIESIKKNIRTAFHVYIVDNCSPDNSFFVLTEVFRNDSAITIIQAGENAGFSRGNNIGIRKALLDDCNCIVVTNPDIVFEENSLESLYEILFRHGKAGLIVPNIRQLDGSHLFGIRPIISFHTAIKGNAIDLTKVKFVGGINESFDKQAGCCVMFKAAALRDAGLYDEKMFLFHEEDVIACKMKAKGYTSLFAGDIEVLHFHNRTIRREGSAFTSYHIAVSLLYFLHNYKSTGGIAYFYIAFYKFVVLFMYSFLRKSYVQYLWPFFLNIFRVYFRTNRYASAQRKEVDVP